MIGGMSKKIWPEIIRIFSNVLPESENWKVFEVFASAQRRTIDQISMMKIAIVRRQPLSSAHRGKVSQYSMAKAHHHRAGRDQKKPL